MLGAGLERSPEQALDGGDVLARAAVRERAFAPHQDIRRPGETSPVAHLLIAGHTCRYRLLSDGRRQITAILVPGDICDLEAVITGRTAFAVGTLTRCTVGEIPVEPSAGGNAPAPEVTAALLARLRRDEAIAREWLVGLGRRSAVERIAHLFCELRARLAAVGLASEERCELRLTQNDLADALGLTSVHVNRSLRWLSEAGLMTLKGGLLVMHDRPALERLAEFDPSYLHR